MRNREAIRARGAALGFTFNMDRRSRVYNTFDAHRLLHWAELEGTAAGAEAALLRAYFTDGEDVSAHDTLVRLAGERRSGQRDGRATDSCRRNLRRRSARDRSSSTRARGIHSVPATIINGQHLISGGQPPEVFEQALAADRCHRGSRGETPRH